MIRFIFNVYLATTIAALIAFTLNYKRMNKYLHKIGLQAVFNEDSLVCLIYCFIPILNIFMEYHIGMGQCGQMKILKNILMKMI